MADSDKNFGNQFCWYRTLGNGAEEVDLFHMEIYALVFDFTNSS